jgi:hypothetical protein
MATKPTKDVGSPLGFWDYDEKDGWGINLSETHALQVFLKVPSTWVLDACRSHPLVIDAPEQAGVAMVSINAPAGAFVPVRLPRYSQRRLKALAELGAIYRQVDRAERTLSDESCETLRGKLRRSVEAYTSEFGKLSDAYEVCRVGTWADYRLYSAIQAIVESKILTDRLRRPPPRELPIFREGDIVTRIEKAFTAVVGIYGDPDLTKIYESSCADDDGLEIKDVEDLLVAGGHLLRLPPPPPPQTTTIYEHGTEESARAS